MLAKPARLALFVAALVVWGIVMWISIGMAAEYYGPHRPGYPSTPYFMPRGLETAP